MRSSTTSWAALSLAFINTLIAATPVPTTINLSERATTQQLSALQSQMPTNGLPAPSNMVLKHVALGVGTQNYTCATPGSTAAPTSNGAKANLYDISDFLSSPMGPFMRSTLPGLALSLSTNMPQLTSFLESHSSGLQLGVHYFNATLTPTFDLTAASEILRAKKANNVAAPADATTCKGLTQEGAVDWLYLTAVDVSSPTLGAVYRIYTAGGVAPTTCANATSKDVTVPYAAEYWFYGPQ